MWRPSSIPLVGYHKWMIWCCWGSIQRNMRSSCFKRWAFIRRLPWLTFFLWRVLRLSSIFRVLDQRHTSCSWHRTFIMSILGLWGLCIVMILLMWVVRNQSWRNVILGMGSSWRPTFSSQSSIDLGISNSMWLLTWRLRPSDSNHHRLVLSISMFWSKYRTRLHYRWPCIHQHSRPINGLRVLHCMVQRLCLRLLVMGRQRMFP